jgi:hypothetical protein
VACILDAVGRNPYFCAGDNPSDHPMMRVSQYRLWLGRLEKPKAQQITSALIKGMGTAGWIVQVCSDINGPHFLTDLQEVLDERNLDATSKASAAILRHLQRQLSVTDLPDQPKLAIS